MSYMLKHGTPGDLDDVCKYLSEEDGRYTCEIQDAVEKNDHDFLAVIPTLEYEYWLENCKDYPNVNNVAHLPPRHYLLDGCGFKAIRVKKNGF